MKRRATKSMLLMLITALMLSMMPLTVSAASNAPGKTKITSIKVAKVSAKTSKTTVTIKWKKAKKATGYIVYEKHGDNKWVKLKTVGKRYTAMKIKRVPSGQYSLRVQAIRKYKGKTYKGKLSAIKTKFIKSPLNIQKYTNVDKSLKNLKVGDFVASYKGNRLTFTCDVTNNLQGRVVTDEIVKATYDELATYKNTAAKMKNTIKKNTGVMNVGITFRFVANGSVIASKSF